MDTSIFQSQTFKALLLYIATLICNAIGRKYNVELNATEIAGMTASLVAFIAGRQWKQTAMLNNGAHPMQQDPPAPAPSPPLPPAQPATDLPK